ncbi:MAG: hypothetical protein ACYDDW_15285, partial [Dermatophilaceae bacterium]
HPSCAKPTSPPPKSPGGAAADSATNTDDQTGVESAARESALGGIGALLGAAVTTRVGLRLGTGRTIIACHAITTVGMLVMVTAGGTSHALASVAVLGTGVGLYGLAMGMSNSHEMSFRQLVTPDELQARTNTTLRSLNRAVMVIAAPLAGILADAWGIRPTLLAAAAVFALVSLGLAASPFRTVRAPV